MASTHLARVIHITGAASLARAVADNKLDLRTRGPEDDLVRGPLLLLAREEKIIHDEARALADARKWPTNLAGDPYGWARLQVESAREALPRLIRIYQREVFELDEFARAQSPDDEVRSLVLGTLDGRRSILAALSATAPKATLPGAK